MIKKLYKRFLLWVLWPVLSPRREVEDPQEPMFQVKEGRAFFGQAFVCADPIKRSRIINAKIANAATTLDRFSTPSLQDLAISEIKLKS